jgi:glycosyltransferase involved in cell wall biosynthesis
LPSQKVEIVGHGINVEAFKPVDTLCFQPLRLITVGRITESKDLETLIRAADLVGKELPVSSCILTIVGVPIRPDDQVYLEKIKVLVEQLGAQERVVFAGKKRYDELPAVLRSQSVFVHASKTGSVDKAVLEALATALPVVSSSEAFCRDSEKTGIIVFDEQNPKALAQIIEKIYHSGILTPNQKGREYVVKNHNLTTLVDRIITYFIAATNI